MKKTTKLLSVILAFVMALSCMTMMASAAKATYQTVADLERENAYSPYGTVTRLNMEVRTSMLLDFLDSVLVNVDFEVNQSIPLIGTIYVNITSVDELCKSIDSIYDLLNSGLSGGLIGMLKSSLGIVADLKTSTWKDVKGNISRSKQAQLRIVQEVFELLGANGDLVESVLTDGIDVGLLNGVINGLADLTAINALVKDVPSAIKGAVYPLMGRQDDDADRRDELGNKNNDIIDIANSFIEGLFTKPMNWTSYRVDENGNPAGAVNAAGNTVSVTMALPIATPGEETDATPSRYFVIDGDTITQYDYQYAGLLGDPVGGDWAETVTYTKSETEEFEGSGTYLFNAPEGYDGDATLKWYKADNVADANGRLQSSVWLPTLKAAFESGALSIDINGDDTPLDLVYRFAPYLFAEMAPTVLNGSAKKLMAEAFDVVFTKIGNKGDANLPAGDFFTSEQPFYVWEYSDYTVIDEVPYYRYQDEFFVGEVPSNISVFYSMINWDYNITGDFVNEFIPAAHGEQSAAGFDWALEGVNNLVKKAIEEMIAPTWTVKGTTYNRSEVFPWEAGSNDYLLTNLMKCARNFFSIAPEEIVDEFVEEAQFYDPMMGVGEYALPEGATHEQEKAALQPALKGLTCELVKLIMPQIVFPNNIIEQPITAILALVVRELCTQLMPTYNFDAMIYDNYGDSTNKDRVILPGMSADYWLDTSLYMGVNLGMYYLRNIADIGEDDAANGYYGAMANMHAIPAATPEGMTFGPTAQYIGAADPANASWLRMVDWIVDWALESDYLWCWKFEKFVSLGTVDLTTYQNPLDKIDTILLQLLPLDEIFNTSRVDDEDLVYGSDDTIVEKVLKNGIINCIVDLDVEKLQAGIQLPEGSLTDGTIADNLVVIIVRLLDNVLKKVAGNVDIVPRRTVNSVDTLLDKNNIKTVLKNLVDALDVAYTNGLLVPVLPIVNFFAGWTTDPQKYAEPSLEFANSNGKDYFYTAGTETLTVTNTSSGMLLKHRDAEGNLGSPDTAYTITVKSITSDDGTVSFTAPATGNAVAPGESKPFTIKTSDTSSRAIAVKVVYTLTGKDGKALGGDRVANSYVYVSSKQDSDTYIKTLKNGTIMVYINAGLSLSTTSGLVVTDPNKLQSEVEGLYVQIENWRDREAKLNKNTYTPGNANIVVNSEGMNYSQVDKKDGDSTILIQYVAKLADTVDVATLPSGQAWNLGSYSLTLKAPDANRTESASGNFGTLYYADLTELKELYRNEILNNRYSGNYTDASWAVYSNTMKDICGYIDDRSIKDNGATFATNYTDAKIAEKIEALESAIAGLKGSSSSSSSSVDLVIDALDGVENNVAYNKNTDTELNFQDYALFEYFKYEEQRNNAREMIANATEPAAPGDRIENEDASEALIYAIIAAQTNANVATGITATVVEPTSEDLANYRAALEDFNNNGVKYSALECYDQASKIQYYADLMQATSKTVDKTFLNQEITYAKAQKYDSSLYSVDSWERYHKAITAAEAVSADANALESEVFDAKYELMVAQNALQFKERSMKDTGYMEQELIPLVEHATAILDNYGTIYAVDSTKGITANAAFGQLVKALGVEYDVTVDGKTIDGILYNRSALTFTNYDRTATAKNKRAVDAAADKLRAAIENFVCTVTLEGADAATTVDQTIRYIKGINPGSISTAAQLLARVTVNGAATAETKASKVGNFGTGARVELKNGDTLLATYFVIIYGDVNGDGAVDAFDAAEVDMKNKTAYYIGDVYDDASDVTGDGSIDNNDYAALKAAISCGQVISQVA